PPRYLHCFPTRRSSDLAPTGSNAQGWHFVVVTDEAKRKGLADIYRRAFEMYRNMPGAAGNVYADDPVRGPVQQRVMRSADYLAEDRKSTRLNSSLQIIS